MVRQYREAEIRASGSGDGAAAATNHIYVALTMNIIADVLIVTRIPPHLRSTAIFLARQRGTCNCWQSDHTMHMLVETKI